MLGGKETPCIPDHYIPKYEEEFGRPCPRIGLLSVNEDASQIVMLALNQYTQPILPAYVSLMDQDVVLEAVDRAVIVLLSKDLHDTIEKAGKTAATKEEAARKVREASKHVVGRR